MCRRLRVPQSAWLRGSLPVMLPLCRLPEATVLLAAPRASVPPDRVTAEVAGNKSLAPTAKLPPLKL